MLQFFLVLEAGETSTIDIIDDLMRFFEKVAATTIFLLDWLNFSKFYGSQCLAGIALPASHQTCQEVILKTFFLFGSFETFPFLLMVSVSVLKNFGAKKKYRYRF